jgi:DNA-binding transcriptional MerR regulator/methylmalonyl-CoA mutase cobalamin-binding subunit
LRQSYLSNRLTHGTIEQAVTTSISNTISDVERETGLAKDTLRVWERRYDFPQPVRDAFGERLYSADQVQKLRTIKRLLDRGHRPGKIIHLNIDALQALAQEPSTPKKKAPLAAAPHPDLAHCLALCKTHDVDALRHKLSQAQLQLGLQGFVIDLVAPLTILVGEAWANGELAVHEEHLYSESLQIVLRNAISHIPQHKTATKTRPRILLTTFPQERHGLGLLMAEALFSLDGASCVSLGVQTPILEIVAAAKAQAADIVALSFSSAMNARQAIDGLTELRSRLPEAVEIWAGGTCPPLLKRPPANIVVMGLTEVRQFLSDWRERQVAP